MKHILHDDWVVITKLSVSNKIKYLKCYDVGICFDNQSSFKMKINKLPVFYDEEMCVVETQFKYFFLTNLHAENLAVGKH